MKKELKMRHIFIPVLVVVILLSIVAVILNNTGDAKLTNTDGQSQSYHIHDDGETHYGEH